MLKPATQVNKAVNHITVLKTLAGTFPGSREPGFCLMTDSEGGLQQSSIHGAQCAFCVPRILLGHTGSPRAGGATHWRTQPALLICFYFSA